MTDIGPGDCVEAVRDSELGGVVYARRGDRDVVAEVVNELHPPCLFCERTDTVGLILTHHGQDDRDWEFCVCGWRKVGPGRDEVVRRFAEDLNVRAPETESV